MVVDKTWTTRRKTAHNIKNNSRKPPIKKPPTGTNFRGLLVIGCWPAPGLLTDFAIGD